MITQLPSNSDQEIIYPESDGQPMADNTKQFRWIVTIKEGLEWLFQDDPNVFIDKEQAQQQLKQERQAKELAQQQLAQERDRTQKLAARLQELGIDPN